MTEVKTDSIPAAEHRTVARVMSMLELVLSSEPNGLRLGELAAAIGAPKSSVHGLAKGMVAAGYFREHDNRYLVGPAISTLIAAGPIALPGIYRHVLQELSERWTETAMLATLVGDTLVYLDSVEPDVLVRAAPKLHRRVPLWPRSTGKCLMAFMEPKRQESYLSRTAADEEEAAQMRKELDEVRRTGTAYNFGGTFEGHLSIASPIIPSSGVVTMAVAVVGIRARMESDMEEIAESIRVAVDSLATRERPMGTTATG
jgi:DNA-binding IclR family transcriptional regulator